MAHCHSHCNWWLTLRMYVFCQSCTGKPSIKTNDITDDTGVISGVLVVLGSDLDGRPVSDHEKELITSLCSAGALVGAVIAGLTSDKYGRKPAIWFASVLFTIGAIVQATSYSIAQMSAGRFLIGLGVGSASMVSTEDG